MKNKFHVELTPELIKKAQEKVNHILNEGCVHEGVSDKFDSTVKPEWLDEERYRKGRKITQKYLVAALNSSLIGLVFLLQQSIVLAQLLATERSKNVSNLFSRYLNTILHVMAWYKYDTFDPESKAFHSIQAVNKMHKNAAKLMGSRLSVYEFAKKSVQEYNKEHNNNSNTETDEAYIEKLIKRKDRVWISSTDMAMTQFAFIGPLILEPRACSMHSTDTKEKLLEIIYVWKVISYRLGIEDEFNLFAELDFDLIYAICKLMFEQAFLPVLESAGTPVGIRMTQGLMKGMQPIIPLLKWKCYCKYWHKTMSVNSYKINEPITNSTNYKLDDIEIKNTISEDEMNLILSNGYNGKYIVPNPQIPFEELKTSSLAEKIIYNLSLFGVNVVLKVKFIRILLGNEILRRLDRALKNKDKNMKVLKKYDKENHYDVCPFACSIDNKYYEYAEVAKK